MKIKKDTINEPKRIGKYIFELFVTKNSFTSSRAIKNSQLLFEKYFKDNVELAIIDVHDFPNETARQQIYFTPTLIRKYPTPEIRITGDLSDSKKAIDMLII